MNTLAYGLLSFLSRESLSGYDLMLRIQPIWEAKHSQIYPLLAKMESQGYIEHVLIAQSDKPDKKVYTITEAGLQALRDWLPQPASEPASRDESLIKAHAIWLSDPATARKVFEDRIASYSKRLQRLEGLRAKYDEDFLQSNADLDILSAEGSRYLLIRRSIEICKSEIEWSQWAISLVEKSAQKQSQHP